MLDNPFVSGDVERMQPRNGQLLSGTRVLSPATRWPQFGLPTAGSVVKCARSQARPFHEDDEAAHEHVTEHMRKVGENDYCDTGQDEPPVDSPPARRESTVTKHLGPSGEGPMEVDPNVRRRMRGKTRTVSTEQPTAPLSNATTDPARLESAGDHDDKRRRVDEPEAPISSVAPSSDIESRVI